MVFIIGNALAIRPRHLCRANWPVLLTRLLSQLSIRSRLKHGGCGSYGAPHRKTEDRATRPGLTGLSVSMACCIEGSPRFKAVQPQVSALARSLGIQNDL